MEGYERCKKCARLVLTARMADHYIISLHYAANLPARSVRFILDTPNVPNVLRRAS